MNPLIVIPARLGSTRLHGKPLADICGRPMVMRVWDRCAQALGSERVVIATDNGSIADVCSRLGANVVMTGDCLTGTDRVAEVASKVPADVYINVQGDEPLVCPDDIRKVIEEWIKFPTQVINAMAPISDESTWRSLTIPKVVARDDGTLIYMSRSPVPGNKSGRLEGQAYRQVCIYAFAPQALKVFRSCRQKTSIEQMEDIEILRFLELGMKVRMVKLSSETIAVDTPEDLARVRRLFK